MILSEEATGYMSFGGKDQISCYCSEIVIGGTAKHVRPDFFGQFRDKTGIPSKIWTHMLLSAYFRVTLSEV